MSQQKKKHLLLGRFGSVYSKEYPEKVSRGILNCELSGGRF